MYPLLSLFASFTLYNSLASIHIYFNQSDWLLYFSGRGGYSGHMINNMGIIEDTVPMCINHYLFTFIMEIFDV